MKLLRALDDVEAEPARSRPYRGSFFHVLHFLDSDGIWAKEVENEFGPEVLEKLTKDRKRLVRELFGTRALHRMPREKRCFNPYDYYQAKIGGGRVVLLPFKIFVAWLKLCWILIRLGIKSARDILDPRITSVSHVDAEAPFAVARRKLRRMKKPLLFEVMRLLARVDPEYLGLGPQGEELPQPGTWLEDLGRIEPTPREQEELEQIRDRASRRLLYLPAFFQSLPIKEDLSADQRMRITSAFAMDEGGIARLAAAEQRARDWLYAMSRGEDGSPGALPRTTTRIRASVVRRGFRLMLESLGTLSRRERRRLRRAVRQNQADIRLVATAFAEAAPLGPGERARQLAMEMLASSGLFTSRVETLRAISGLVVQDLQHHEDLIHDLGGYARTEKVPLVQSPGSEGQAQAG